MNVSTRFTSPTDVMRRAIELARRGEGHVEPNPMVGAVIVDERLQCLGEGYHERFGGPHAEVQALHAAGNLPHGAALYVTLEPCCHHGKTPPCVDAVLQAGIRRVIVGMQDPFPKVAGGGIARLREAGVDVDVGLLEAEVRTLTNPFRKLVETGFPWVHAKWAMTLDGKIASRTGHSQWISNSLSRGVVHRLRGRMDAILVGIGTALADDPLLTARPPGARVATRIVLDTDARVPIESQLVRTAEQAPVLIAVSSAASAERISALRERGVEVLSLPEYVATDDLPTLIRPATRLPDLRALFRELGSRQFTNVLVEGGAAVLGTCFDQQLIDELHVFIAPKLVGGSQARTALAGRGLDEIPPLATLPDPQVTLLGEDVYVHGILRDHRGS